MSTKEEQQKVVQQQFTDAVQLLALLKQIGVTSKPDDTNLPIDSKTDTKQEPSSTPPSQELQRQRLLDGLTFVAGAGSEFPEMTAMMMKVNPQAREVCFRMAISESESEIVLDRVSKLQDLLNKLLSAYDSSSGRQDPIIEELFDEILPMKKHDLKKDLRGNQEAEDGLLTALTKTIDALMTSKGKPSFPPYSPSVRPSPTEVTEVGPYTQETHRVHMEATFTRLKDLGQLVRKACNSKKGKKAKARINVPASKELILFAHGLKSYPVFTFLISQQPSHTSTQTLQLIERISNYRQTCIDIAEGVSSFAGVKEVKFLEIPKAASM